MKLSEIKSNLCIKNHLCGRRTSASVNVGCWEITTSQRVDEDHTLGAKFTVSDRAIIFRRKHGRGYISKKVSLVSWSGNYIERAIVTAGLAPKKISASLDVRLHKAFDAKLIKTVRGHEIYERILLGSSVDYVMVAPMGATFRSDNYIELVWPLILGDD